MAKTTKKTTETKTTKTKATPKAAVTPATCPAKFEDIWQLVAETSKNYEKPAADYFLAVQVNLTGENGGTFYIALRNGDIEVAPYEYNDRSCGITISPENFLKLMDDKLDAVLAFTTGKLKVDGSIEKALEFSKIVKNNAK